MARLVNPTRVYEDYDPPSDLVSEQGCDTILIYLPGYKKEQLRVQLTTSRILKISGERQIGDNKWRRFNKEFRVPTDCETKDISAKFEGGILYIRQPKVITPAAPPTAAPPPEAEAVASPPQPPPEAEAVASPPQPPPLHASQPPQQQPQTQPQTSQQSQSQSQSQTQQHASLSESQKGSDQEKTEKNDPRKDEISKEKKPGTFKEDEEGKRRRELRLRPKELVGRGGFFTELSKPENCKRLAVSVLVVLSIGFYSAYMFKSFMEDDKEF